MILIKRTKLAAPFEGTSVELQESAMAYLAFACQLPITMFRGQLQKQILCSKIREPICQSNKIMQNKEEQVGLCNPCMSKAYP